MLYTWYVVCLAAGLETWVLSLLSMNFLSVISVSSMMYVYMYVRMIYIENEGLRCSKVICRVQNWLLLVTS